MPIRVKILNKLWFFFFLISIGVVGTFFSVLFYFPLRALSLIWPNAKPAAEGVFAFGNRVLLRVQPWFHGDVRIEVPREPDVGTLFVSNHRSHLDVFVLLTRIPGVRVLAKSTLFYIPVLGFMMRATGQIRAERGRLASWVQAMDRVTEALMRGHRVHIFPELTRCEPGANSVRPFVIGPFRAARQAGAMVVPIVFTNTDAVWPKGTLGVTSGARVHIESLPAIRASDFPSAELLRDEVHRRIEDVLQQTRASVSQPLEYSHA